MFDRLFLHSKKSVFNLNLKCQKKLKKKNYKQRDGFTFFKSYDDSISMLSDEQLSSFIRALLDVQFLRVRYEDVSFNDNMLKMLWQSQKYNIESQVDGYLNNKAKNKDLFLGVYDNSNGGSNGGSNNAYDGALLEEEVQGEEEVQVEEEEKESDNKLPPPPIKKSEFEDDAIYISKYLLQNIYESNPTFKGNSDNWIAEIERAMRIDGRTKDELIACIDWIHKGDGSFWIGNILSGKKLREKFDTLKMQSLNKKQTKSQRRTSSNMRVAQELLEEHEILENSLIG